MKLRLLQCIGLVVVCLLLVRSTEASFFSFFGGGGGDDHDHDHDDHDHDHEYEHEHDYDHGASPWDLH